MVSTELYLFIESFEDELKELKMYSPLEDFYSRLDFEKHSSDGGTLETFAKKILEYY